MVKSPRYSSKGPELSFQHPCQAAHNVTPVPWDLTPLASQGTGVHVHTPTETHTHTQKADDRFLLSIYIYGKLLLSKREGLGLIPTTKTLRWRKTGFLEL